jgi:nickel-dependent lactate racemase
VVTHFAEPEKGTAVSSIPELTLRALSQPKGTAAFKELLLPGKKLAIIVDDLTRPTPVPAILQTFLSYVEEHGFPRESVTVVIAVGTHEAMKKDEIEKRVGAGVAARYRIIQHNAWQKDLVPVMLPGDGRVVKINPYVAGADLKVGISSILPHPKAGFGGGPKVIMPGVSNFEFIRDHHMTHLMENRFKVGITKGNRFHKGCMEAARAVGLDFTLNCVYDQKGEIADIIGGALDEAFAGAIALAVKKLGQRFEEKVDVTITSTFPHVHAHQLFKGVAAPDVVTKETGNILLVAPVTAPVAPAFLASFDEIREKSQNDSAAYVKDCLSKGKAFLPDRSIDFNMALSTAFTRPRIKTLLVSPDISEEEARTMGLGYAASVEAGLSEIAKSTDRQKVAIFPAGGLIVPVTSWER